MNAKVYEAMNDQIKHELYSAYFYLSMSAYCETENLPGFAKWLKVQAEEEQEHAMKLYDYLLDRGEKISLKAIEQPPVEFKGVKDVFTKVYEHEQKVTGLINGIYAKAVEANDVASQIFLQWFINEQVEEEKNASSVLAMVTKLEGSLGGLYQLDHQLGMREAD
ncbi:MAG TPA: ferritin [Anaerolineaceae bacterium]|jgi:ferritin|nr:ferritin [Anaerolineaceae bacterium]NMC17367.1 ferritin [Chloroflexota bacterium]HNS07889.1 ferritin [Anaerolineaceae bacterium]HOE02802.1 ferritin [Anaerolineaceae bacterium]HOQ69370.1 ferritin [Anaerolineaceae bacterium]